MRADQSIADYMVEFVVSAIAREDTRCYTLGHGGFKRRARYSLSQIFVTKSDSGKKTFNSGEVLGAHASSGISETYYPRATRSVGNVMSKYVQSLGIDALAFFLREFTSRSTAPSPTSTSNCSSPALSADSAAVFPLVTAGAVERFPRFVRRICASYA